MFSKDDKVHIMQRNAEQILEIVKASFADYSFHNVRMSVNCTSPQSDGEVLSCLWAKVEDTLPTQDGEVKEALQALNEVLVAAVLCRMRRLTSISSQNALKRS